MGRWIARKSSCRGYERRRWPDRTATSASRRWFGTATAAARTVVASGPPSMGLSPRCTGETNSLHWPSIPAFRRLHDDVLFLIEYTDHVIICSSSIELREIWAARLEQFVPIDEVIEPHRWWIGGKEGGEGEGQTICETEGWSRTRLPVVWVNESTGFPEKMF